MATIVEAFKYASQNPDSDFAKNLAQLASSGSLDVEAKANGIDLTPFKQQQEQTQVETPEQKLERQRNSVADFTGGKEIAQGLGQALAQKGNSKRMSESLNSAIDIQTKLLKLIKEKKALGQDTSRLETALSQQDELIQNIGDATGKILNPNDLNAKQVLGDALQLATTAGGAKLAGGIAGKATSATGIGAGLVQGAKTGIATGSTLGAVTGVSQGLQNNESGSEIAKNAVTGAITGGIGGGILGATTGAISGGINQSIQNKKDFAKNLVSPELTSSVKEQALQEGRVTKPGLLQSSKVLPSKRDEQLAEAVKDYVSSKKSVIENGQSIQNGIDEINNGVKDYVKSNKTIFNTNQLKSKLNSGKDELKLIFASDSNAEKTYNAVVKEFMKHVQNKDTAGLLEARQKFDNIPAIKKLLDSQGLGENVKKEVALTVRGQANKYIASLLPEGNEYRAKLLQESRMIEALGNIAAKNKGIIGKNGLQLLTEKYPILKWAVGGAVGAAGIGVGGSIIGSSD